jgi:hypothetical protein
MAMRAFCFAVLSLLLFAGQSAQAQQATVTGATMLWYGVYTVRQAKEIKDPNSAAGVRWESTGIAGPANNSERIALRDNIRFGFGYDLLGRPRGKVVPIVHVTYLPDADKPDKTNYDLAIGQEGLFIGRKIENAATTLTGVYKFQVWHNNRMLLEKLITVYRP